MDISTRTLSVLPGGDETPLGDTSLPEEQAAEFWGEGEAELEFGGGEPAEPGETLVEFVMPAPHINLLGFPLDLESAEKLYEQLGAALVAAKLSAGS